MGIQCPSPPFHLICLCLTRTTASFLLRFFPLYICISSPKDSATSIIQGSQVTMRLYCMITAPRGTITPDPDTKAQICKNNPPGWMTTSFSHPIHQSLAQSISSDALWHLKQQGQTPSIIRLLLSSNYCFLNTIFRSTTRKTNTFLPLGNKKRRNELSSISRLTSAAEGKLHLLFCRISISDLVETRKRPQRRLLFKD